MVQNIMDAAKAVLSRKCITKQSYLKNKEKISKQPNLTPKATRERRTNKIQSQQKERNHKDQSRNKLGRDEQQETPMKLKAGSLRK